MHDQLDNDLSLTKYYWYYQSVCWVSLLVVYVIFVLPNNRLQTEGIESVDRLLIVGVYIVLLGFFGSHLLRVWYKSQNWIELGISEFWKRALSASYVVALCAAILEIPILEVVDFFLPPPELLADAFQDLGVIASSVSFRIFRSSLFMWVIYISWGGVYWGLKTWNINRVMKLRNSALQVEQKIAELRQLNQQLNPHFLFNSLNNIRALIHSDKDRAAELISSLSSILRNTLSQKKDLISLREEIGIVNDFLELEKARLEDRLEIVSNWSEDSLDFKIPPMFLQTLTENAIKHGISSKVEGGILQLESRLVENGMVVEICNDGELGKEIKGMGIGLENCRERLRLLYDGKAELNIYQKENLVHTDLFIPNKFGRN
ncbi:MAG: hypothetical protein COA78_04010 [Blastopirellula sp.]|nr:MAG: hypothetical protein COA78_04010 [Blastopirellula sp.]